ncbi:MAG: hypothetical protein CSA52_01325 [Gammaproteobacteria bacterium]|nr:MAG: hypothetical protein CSB48_09835 [Pseudomonadota bacterium]PIE38721.1 MAG: hypothetical protein CSA52_01325 [Gammaproteobacteria bacterium]
MNVNYKALVLAPLISVMAACSGGSGALGGIDTSESTSDGGSPAVSLGILDTTGNEAVFTKSAIDVESNDLDAEGQTLASVNLVNDSDHTLYLKEATVTFSSTCVEQGLATITGSVTTSTGLAQALYQPDGCEGTDTITASLPDGQSASVNVTVEPVVLSLGILGDDAFSRGAMNLTTTNLSAGGETTATVNVVKEIDNSLYTRVETVHFTSTCVAQGLATITSNVSTDTGIAQALYVANGCEGSDTITASIDDGNVVAIGNIIVAPLEFGALAFTEADPTSIGLKNISNPVLGTVSEVRFQLLDKTKNPIKGEKILFTLSSTEGASDAALTNEFDTTDAEGIARAFVSGGAEKGTVRVIATVESDTSLSTQSGSITITTGIATQRSLSLALSVFNPPHAWETDGVTLDATVRVSDFYNNPVAEGTKVLFYTSHGQIQPECEIGPDGGCSVTWTSQAPRSDADDLAFRYGGSTINNFVGTAAIMATIKGEETTGPDNNANGLYDANEKYIPRPEAFVDFNANGRFDRGETYIDWNNNGKFDTRPASKFRGSRCAPDTLANGACAALADIFTVAYIDISARVLPSGILFYADETLTNEVGLGVGGALGTSVTLVVQDLNGNSPGNGTSVSFEAKPVDDNTEIEVLSDDFSINERNRGPSITTLSFRVVKTLVENPGAFLGTINVKVTNPDNTVATTSLFLTLGR